MLALHLSKIVCEDIANNLQYNFHKEKWYFFNDYKEDRNKPH